MLNRIALLSFLFLIKISLAFGQPADVIIGPDVVFLGYLNEHEVAGSDSSGFYLLRFSTDLKIREEHPMRLEYFDRANNLVYSKPFALPKLKNTKEELALDRVVLVGGQPYLVTEFEDSKTNTLYKYASRFSGDGQLLPELVEIGKIENKDNKKNSGGFSVNYSQDSSMLMVAEYLPYEKDGPREMNFRIWNSKLQPVYAKKITRPRLDAEDMVSNFALDNQGNFFFLISAPTDYAERNRNIKKNYHRIIGYYHKTDSVKEMNIRLPEKFITNLVFAPDKNNNLAIAGFYSELRTLQEQGVFYLSINLQNQKILSKTTKAFPPETLKNVMSGGIVAEGFTGLNRFNADKLMFRKDGSLVFTGQQAWQTYSEPQSQSRPNAELNQNKPGRPLILHDLPVKLVNYRSATGIFTYYNYGLSFADINPKGDITSITYLPRKYESMSDAGKSNRYAVHAGADNLNVLYIDNIKNIAVTDSKLLTDSREPKDLMPVLVTIAKDGTYKKALPVKNFATSGKWVPESVFRGSNYLNIVAYRKSTFRICKVVFN